MAEYRSSLTAQQIEDSLLKIRAVQSSPDEIDALSGSHTDNLFRLAKDGRNTNVQYIVTGDSTRDNSYNQMIDYYTSQLAKINVTVFNNSASGQSGQDWKNSANQTTLNQAIAATSGQGENTILEFSHGINDYKNGATEADVKGWLQEGITGYLTAKPKATIILAVPVSTSDSARITILTRIYQELASENNLRLIDVTVATQPVLGNTRYYQDTTHPNKFGSRRIVNYIMSELLPLDVLSSVTIEEIPLTPPPSTAELATDTTLESGYWNTSSGGASTNAAWLRMATRIAVEPNFVLHILRSPSGNRYDTLFYDSSDVFIETQTGTDIGSNIREYTIPGDAWFIRLNITSDESTYVTSDPISVKYYDSSAGLHLTVDEMNKDMPLKNRTDLGKVYENLTKMETELSLIDPEEFINKANVVWSPNIIPREGFVLDHYMSTSGVSTASTSYRHSAMVAIKPDTQYVNSERYRFVTFYDTDQIVISGLDLTAKGVGFVTPVNARYVVVSEYQNNNPAQLEEGTVSTGYKPFGKLLDEQVKDHSIGIQQVNFITLGKNKFDVLTAVEGYYLTDTGAISANSTYCYSQKIEVTPGGDYYCNKNMRYWCEYDADAVVVGGSSANISGAITVGATTTHIVLTFNMADKDTAQFEPGTVGTTYQQYAYILEANGYPVLLSNSL